MRLPRDLSGAELARLLAKYEYRATRQTGSHIRLTSTIKGKEHHITIPQHSPLKIGTLSGILTEVAEYLKKDKKDLFSEFFRQ